MGVVEEAGSSELPVIVTGVVLPSIYCIGKIVIYCSCSSSAILPTAPCRVLNDHLKLVQHVYSTFRTQLSNTVLYNLLHI